jgi:hypothetical protein
MISASIVICLLLTAGTPALAKATATKPTQRTKPTVQRAAMCWQDYCPCESQGGISAHICRRLRAGLPVDKETFSLGALQRDALAEIDASGF